MFVLPMGNAHDIALFLFLWLRRLYAFSEPLWLVLCVEGWWLGLGVHGVVFNVSELGCLLPAPSTFLTRS